MLEQSLNNITRLKLFKFKKSSGCPNKYNPQLDCSSIWIEEQSDCGWYLLGHPEDFVNDKIMQTFTNVKLANLVS